MARQFYDFDAAAEEGEPVEFRLLGRDWSLPGTPPAAALLRIDRAMVALAELEQTGQVPDDLVVDASLTAEGMCRALAGDEVVDEWLELGIDYPTLKRVTRRLMAIYRGEDPDADPNPEPPNRAAKRAAAKKKPSASRRATSSKGGRR